MYTRKHFWSLGRFMLLITACLDISATGAVPAGAAVVPGRGPSSAVPVRIDGGTLPRVAGALRAAPASSGVFMNRSFKTDSVSIAVDANGGTHLAYSGYRNDPNNVEPALYAYCASNCGSLASWGIASVTDGVSTVAQVQLAVNPAGHPRLLLDGRSGNHYRQLQYAACDSGCTDGANWTVLSPWPITDLDVNSSDYSQHTFALDPQGRPRFVYYDDNWPHGGLYYAYCDVSCTTPANWYEVQLSTDLFRQLSLTFTAAGQPRLASVIYTQRGPTGNLNYLTCDTACSTAANWTVTPLYERGGGHASWDLHLDSSGRPRMAFYQAVPAAGGGNVLYYVWCNSGCTTAANWGGSSVGLATSDGTDPALALDSQNRPRIAYEKNTGNLGFGTCSSNCESNAGSWQHSVVETGSVLDADWPIPPPANCSSSYWYAGYRPSLALDNSSNARVGYVGSHLYGGGCTVGEDYHAVRFVSYYGGVQSFVYVPLIVR